MADWGNFERYAMLAGTIVFVLLLVAVFIYWYRHYRQTGKFVVPPSPVSINRPPDFINQPFALNSLYPQQQQQQQQQKQPQPGTYVSDLNKHGKNLQVKHGKKSNKYIDDSSSDSCDDNNGDNLQIYIYLWAASYCDHSKHFWTVWRNVQKRLKKHRHHGVKITFLNRLCDGRDQQEWKQTLVDGRPIVQFPTVSIAVKDQPQQLLCDQAIPEEELENRINNYIRVKKQSTNQ